MRCYKDFAAKQGNERARRRERLRMVGSNIFCRSLLKVSKSVLFSVESFILVARESGDLSVALGPRCKDACCSASAHSVKGKAPCSAARAGGGGLGRGLNGTLGSGNGG